MGDPVLQLAAAPATANPALALLDLAHRAREAASADELAFLLVNDTRALLPYRQAALWFADGGVRTLSGVVQLEGQAPYVQWLDRLFSALARQPGIARVVAFVPPVAPAYVHELRAELPGVEFVPVERIDLVPVGATVDLVYRPYQVTRLADVALLEQVAERFVVNQLDTIAFENPAYFASDQHWLAYRDATRLALELAHGVAFLSEAGRRSTHSQGASMSSTTRSTVPSSSVIASTRSPTVSVHAGWSPP